MWIWLTLLSVTPSTWPISASELDDDALEEHGAQAGLGLSQGGEGFDDHRDEAAVRRIELGAAEEPDAIADAAVTMALRGVLG